MTRYVALLRGINVGGKNVIRMSDLKRCFEGLGVASVTTSIQSGNVLFDADRPEPAALAARIEEALSSAFRYDARIVLRSEAQMRAIVAGAPSGFGTRPELYRYDVMFLMEPSSATDVLDQLTLREGVDQAFAGDGVCYFSRLISRASQSYLSRVAGLPVYQRMTMRNWNTTLRLLALIDAPRP